MQKTPTNPYLGWAFALAGITIGLGLILHVVGWFIGQAARYDEPLAGADQVAIGSYLVSLGFIGLLIALAAGAITWRPVVAPEPEPIDPDSL